MGKTLRGTTVPENYLLLLKVPWLSIVLSSNTFLIKNKIKNIPDHPRIFTKKTKKMTNPPSETDITNNNPTKICEMTTTNATKMAEKRKAPPPFGLSPPSESKLLQRRQTKQSQSLNYSCRVKSGITKNSNSFVNVSDLVSNIVESPGC